jgi:hypothetical protein
MPAAVSWIFRAEMMPNRCLGLRLSYASFCCSRGDARLSNWIYLIDSAIPAERENVRLDTLPCERAY